MNPKVRKYLNLFLISMGASCIYKLPYLRSTYYVAMMEAFHVTNTQIGILMSSYAITQALSFLPGGWLVDFLPVKYIMPVGLVTTGLLGFLEAGFPGYRTLILIQMGYGITSNLFFWVAMHKATRMLAEEGEQGRMFGLQEGIRGLTGALFAFTALGLFRIRGEGPEGLRTAILFYCIILIAIGIVFFFLMDKNEVEGRVTPLMALQGVVEMLQLKRVWLAAGIVFFGYALCNGLSYQTPMLVNLFGVRQTTSAALSLLMHEVVSIAAGPLAGIMADRTGSSVRFLQRVISISGLSVLCLLLIPFRQSLLPLIIGVMLVTSVTVYMMRGTYYSTTGELDIPLTKAGAAMGAMSLVGNAPDLFAYTLNGRLLDRFPGGTGYRLIFVLMFLYSAGAVLCAARLRKMLHK